MSDREFEKQVRQKLNDLRFTPSAEAWEKIEHGLSQSKRRRAPYFWLPLIIIGLAAGGYFMFSNNTEQAVLSEKMNASQLIEEKLLNENAKPAVEPRKNVEATPNKATNNAEKGEVQDLKKVDAQTGKQSKVRKSRQTTSQKTAEEDGNQLIGNKEGATHETPSSDQSAIADNSIDKNLNNGNQVFEAGKTLLHYTRIPGQQLIPSIKPFSSIQASNNTRMPGVTDLPPVKSDKINSRKWSFGVYAIAGVSAVNEGDFLNFSKPKVQDVAYRPSFSSNAIAPSYTPSSLSPGFSYSAGATVKRQLSRRFSVSSGINYLQLNTKNKVGDKVYGSQVVNNGTRGYLYVFNYYRLEQDDKPSDYKNKYHFVEIPLNLNIRLNKSQQLPIDWNGGIAVAYLIESNSLHFDGTTGVYYKDDKLLNKTQVAVTTGFSFTLFNKTAFPVSVGPSARYNLSPILHKDVSASKNFMSLGLATRIFLK